MKLLQHRERLECGMELWNARETIFTLAGKRPTVLRLPDARLLELQI